jgi:hypothetical protein
MKFMRTEQAKHALGKINFLSASDHRSDSEVATMIRSKFEDDIRAVLSDPENVTAAQKYSEVRFGGRGSPGLRFEMSGYGSNCSGYNNYILGLFSGEGIYDTTLFLYLDFYKGDGTIYYKNCGNDLVGEESVAGMSTSEIIYKVFELTVFTKGTRRRRD